MTPNQPATAKQVRCAVYTRKSSDEGLEKEFNTLDAQREAGEAYIKSQAQEGWICLPDCYDDGGFTGANLERPALQRLLADVEARKVDCVVLYKIDRLSRSLLDFARLMETFDRHQVSFVSVTQQVNSATSMGRLMLNVLLSFAQFERELIGERTRDKIAAARRKGKWSGGMPLLGYDVDPQGSKLVVNEAEAVRVRAIFALYRKHQALLPVVQELERRGWKTKQWTTRKGKTRGGVPFTRTNLYQLLTRVAYIGRIQYKHETHPGEHPAIVDPEVWQRVQVLLRRHGRRDPVRCNSGALLQRLLRCASCGCHMVPTYCLRNAITRYRYYRCSGAQRRGARTCPSNPLPAHTIEQFVLDQVRALVNDPARLQEMSAALAANGSADDPPARDVDVLGPEQLRLVLDPAWEQLPALERVAILRGLVQGVDFDGVNHKIAITFCRRGVQALAAKEALP
jgi:site-specific DNA recombinase